MRAAAARHKSRAFPWGCLLGGCGETRAFAPGGGWGVWPAVLRMSDMAVTVLPKPCMEAQGQGAHAQPLSSTGTSPGEAKI